MLIKPDIMLACQADGEYRLHAWLSCLLALLTLTCNRRLKSFIDDVNRERLPAFTLRTLGGGDVGLLSEEKSKIFVDEKDLENVLENLPPHIASRHRKLEEVTKNMQTTMAGAMEMRDGHLTEKLTMLREAQVGAHRFQDGADDAASEAGMAYLMGIFDRQQAAAISIQRAFRSFLSRRGPMDNQGKPFKAKARYWQPVEHRPTREAKLTKDDILKRSRAALTHAEDAVGQLEKQASDLALSMGSKMRVPRAGASSQYRLDDRDYKILLLGREFVEKQEAEEAEWQEEMVEKKKLEVERQRMEELLERERANPLMEKVRRTMKSMASCMSSFDPADLQEGRESLIDKMLFGNGLALISAAIKEHSLTGEIKIVISRFVVSRVTMCMSSCGLTGTNQCEGGTQGPGYKWEKNKQKDALKTGIWLHFRSIGQCQARGDEQEQHSS
jgi:hypothetical protein